MNSVNIQRFLDESLVRLVLLLRSIKANYLIRNKGKNTEVLEIKYTAFQF